MKLRAQIVSRFAALPLIFAVVVVLSGVLVQSVREELVGVADYHLPIAQRIADLDVATYDYELTVGRSLRRAEAVAPDPARLESELRVRRDRIQRDLDEAQTLLAQAIADERNGTPDRLVLARIHGTLELLARSFDPFLDIGDQARAALAAGSLTRARELAAGFASYERTIGSDLASVREALSQLETSSVEASHVHLATAAAPLRWPLRRRRAARPLARNGLRDATRGAPRAAPRRGSKGCRGQLRGRAAGAHARRGGRSCHRVRRHGPASARAGPDHRDVRPLLRSAHRRPRAGERRRARRARRASNGDGAVLGHCRLHRHLGDAHGGGPGAAAEPRLHRRGLGHPGARRNRGQVHRRRRHGLLLAALLAGRQPRRGGVSRRPRDRRRARTPGAGAARRDRAAARSCPASRCEPASPPARW